MSCHTNDEEEEGLESMLFSTLFSERNYKIVFSIAIELHIKLQPISYGAVHIVRTQFFGLF